MIDEGLQRSITFTLNFLAENSTYASYADYIEHERDIDEKLRLTREIDAYHEQTWQNKYSGYGDFFNFGLNTTTWRLLVNKQILMRHERLFIERQMNEVNSEKKKLEMELKSLQSQIDHVKEQQKDVIEGKSSSYTSGGYGGHSSHGGGHGGNHQKSGGGGYRGSHNGGGVGGPNKRLNYGHHPSNGGGNSHSQQAQMMP